MKTVNLTVIPETIQCSQHIILRSIFGLTSFRFFYFVTASCRFTSPFRNTILSPLPKLSVREKKITIYPPSDYVPLFGCPAEVVSSRL